MISEIHVIQYEEIEAESLASWIAGDVWPYHLDPHPTIENVQKLIVEGHFGGDDNMTFWIYLEDEVKPIGIVVLREIQDITPVFDIRIRSSFRGQGIGRKILGWIAEYVFTNLGKHRVEGHTRSDNIAMQRTFLAAGWVKEAHYRQAWPDSDGKYHDALTYAFLKSDWESGETTEIDWI